MSFLLLNQDQIAEITLNKPFTSNLRNYQQEQTLYRQKQQLLINQHPQKNTETASQILKMNAERTQAIVILREVQGGYCLTLSLKVNCAGTAARLRIINKQGSALKLNNIRRVSQFSLKMSQFLACFKQWQVTIASDIATGEVVIQLPICIPVEMRLQSFAQLFYKAHINPYLPHIEYIIQQCVLPGAAIMQNFSKKKAVDSVFRYYRMLHITSHFNESRLETEQEKLIKENKRNQDIGRIIGNSVKLGDSFRLTEMYETSSSTASLPPPTDINYQLEHDEKKYIQSLLAMPVQFKPKNPYQNLMILNHIFVSDIHNLALRKINAGGFSSIYITQIKYHYVYSTDDHEWMNPSSHSDHNSPDKQLRKYVVIKKEEAKGDRGKHQREVLKKIKNGCSIFLPKYYIVVNKDNPYKDSVFMDYIPSRNLKEFLHVGATSVSLLTKLYLIFSIIQSLRYIRDYRIVHLDLKPNNIMIFVNMLIKLIDFGEAYHPELTSHNPGFTVPYSPPEMFNKRAEFSSKSDIFSLGVLMFEMLYGTYPFDFFDPRISVEEQMQGYLKKWFFSPEDSETYGEGLVIRLLNEIISKCLARIPSQRPQLDWIALIIKHCFELLQ